MLALQPITANALWRSVAYGQAAVSLCREDTGFQGCCVAASLECSRRGVTSSFEPSRRGGTHVLNRFLLLQLFVDQEHSPRQDASLRCCVHVHKYLHCLFLLFHSMQVAMPILTHILRVLSPQRSGKQSCAQNLRGYWAAPWIEVRACRHCWTL